MATPFKLKSGNSSAFKNLGSSPAKHLLRREKNAGYTYPGGENETITKEVKHTHPKNEKEGDKIPSDDGKSYVISDKKETNTPVQQRISDLPKNFNATGSGVSTTPGYSTTKAVKTKLPKNFNATGSRKAGKFATKSIKPLLKGLAKKATGVLGIVLGATKTSTADQPTDKQKGVNKKQNVDFKGINKDLSKSMYKPLPKQ